MLQSPLIWATSQRGLTISRLLYISSQSLRTALSDLPPTLGINRGHSATPSHSHQKGPPSSVSLRGTPTGAFICLNWALVCFGHAHVPNSKGMRAYVMFFWLRPLSTPNERRRSRSRKGGASGRQKVRSVPSGRCRGFPHQTEVRSVSRSAALLF